MNEEAGPRWLESERAWHITRYADVALLLKNEAVTIAAVASELEKLSSRMGGGAFSNLILLLGSSYPFQDGEAHEATRGVLRKMVAGAAQRWTAQTIAALVERLLAPFADGTPFDAVEVLARGLPAVIVSDMLGIGAEEIHLCGALERDISAIWHSEILPLRELKRLEEKAAQIVAVFDRAWGAERRGDFARLAFLTMAGVDTTAGLIGSAIDTLAMRPALQDALHAAPERIPAFVGETLRYRPPLRRLVGRRTTAEVALSQGVLPSGALLVIDLERAHRDGEAYPDPERFDLERAGPPSLAFGFGAHTCVGAALARLEARIVIERLVSTRLIQSCGDAVRAQSPDWNEFQSLPVRLKNRC